MVLENNQLHSQACAVVDCWRSDAFAEAHMECCELRGFYGFGVLTTTEQVLGSSLSRAGALHLLGHASFSCVSQCIRASPSLSTQEEVSYQKIVLNLNISFLRCHLLPTAMFPSSGMRVRDGYWEPVWGLVVSQFCPRPSLGTWLNCSLPG